MEILLSLALATVQATPSVLTLNVDPSRAPVTVYLPSSVSPINPRPLIVGLHPFGSYGDRLEATLQFLPLQNTYEFIYCTPDAAPNGTGALQSFWDASDACCNYTSTPVNDAAYIKAVIDAISAATTVDPRHVHVIGYSNGAFMAQKFACTYPDDVASVTSIAGTDAASTTSCSSGTPVHVLHIHGTADGTAYYNGGQLVLSHTGGPTTFPAHLGAMALAQRWASRNLCAGGSQTSSSFLDLDANTPNNLGGGLSDSTRTTFNGPCSAGGTVELWTIDGGGHGITPTADMSVAILDFMMARPKPAVDPERFCSPPAANSQGRYGIIDADGSDVIVDNALDLSVTGLCANELGMFVVSNLSAPSSGGLCLGSPILRLDNPAFTTDAFGSAAMPADLPTIDATLTVVSGATLHFQSWSRDPGSAAGFQYSDAISVVLQ